MTIGQVAQLASVNVQTVRYYERAKLIPAAARSAAGYRIFTEDAVRRIRFVKHAQQLGFSLRQIRDLLSLSISSASQCSDVREKAEQKVSEIKMKIDALTRMQQTLESLVVACESGNRSKNCPILDALVGEVFELAE